ncbi:ABC transporter permease [Microbacterium sp. SSM24]|uniref:ABC transporter permease n=1 Tax=Microbacterium sp. SSM24 TaxID=2991714 RepID=UPI0022264A9F|nr:ABC transporter permease [Microbacterium sp. SSM24]MCW3492612.1 ABC transporter permease [Microbacterium sp. SSM24]
MTSPRSTRVPKTDGARQSVAAQVIRAFRKNRPAVVGLVILGIVIMVALLADLIVPYQSGITQNAAIRLQGPSLEHLFGADEYGRDVFARIVHGARSSIAIGIGATAISLLIGTILGAIAGLYGGAIDTVIMRTCDILSSIPFLLLALAIVAALGPSMLNLMIAMTVASSPEFTRMIRSVILSISEQDFIVAARGAGTNQVGIIFKHVIPNAAGPIIVQGSMALAAMILGAAGLSYIGMGVNPPAPEWGSMLNAATEYISRAPHLLFFAGGAITLAALSMNLVGDGVRDAFDPRMR